MIVKQEKRVFVGFPVSRELARTIPLLRSTIPDERGCIRWLSGKNIHFTLSFLGNVTNDKIPELIVSLKKTVNFNYFNMTIEDTGAFPNSRKPRILWLGVKKGVKELTKLQTEIEKAVKLFRENPKKVNFTPHITVARIRQLNRKIDVSPFLNTVYSPIEFDVNSIYLYESQLLPKGAEYKVLAEFPLN